MLTRFIIGSMVTGTLVACTGASDSDAVDTRSVTAPQVLASSCSGCHTANLATMPSIVGWSKGELQTALMTYQNDPGDTVMHRLMRGFTDEEIKSIAAELGSSP